MHKPGKTRSKTGCRTCRVRKVKCDEEKQKVHGYDEPQCKRCLAAKLRCEWKGGLIPRKSAAGSSNRSSSQKAHEKEQRHHTGGLSRLVRKSQYPSSASNFQKTPSLSLQRVRDVNNDHSLQAANALTLSAFDRDCLSYLQDSTLVIVLGKHWPWSTISYAYHKIAVKESMVMSMILASTARDIHRSRLYDQEALSEDASSQGCGEIDGSMHYGQALSGLRHALKQDMKSPQKIEAIFITLWLMLDYENRFGSGLAAINIHIRGIESLLHEHIVPLLQQGTVSGEQMSSTPVAVANRQETAHESQTKLQPSMTSTTDKEVSSSVSSPKSLDGLRRTSVPLFLLWTLYFFTPAALFFGPGTTRLDTDIYQFFLNAEHDGDAHFSLPELYRISRQSPSRFWGEEYPMSAQLDDMENLPGLTLYHRSHVIQFKITELFKQGVHPDASSGEVSPYQQIVDEINTISSKYDTVLITATTAPSCETINDRRVLETVHWAAITFYSTIVFFHLCFQSILNSSPATRVHSNIMSLSVAVSQVLELSLKLHRSRPRLMVRITWPLFLAGIATSDRIYQDWVSIRLRELGRYGQNYTRISLRFDEIIRGSQPYTYQHHCVIST